MSKFKVGDKVKVVKEYHGGLVRRLGETYTVDKIVDVVGIHGVYVNDEASWLADENYELATAHKHAALIKQWADNPNIKLQWFNTMEGKWYDMSYTPVWNSSEVRIKPEPKPDVIRERQIYVHGDHCALSFLRHEPNVRFTFDGETNKLKSVEMI